VAVCERPEPAPVLGLSLDADVRARVRASLGISEGATVGLLVGGEPGEADAARLVFLLGLIEEGEWPVVWTLPASSAQMDRGRRLLRRSGWRSRVVATSRPFAEQAAAADFGLWLGPATAGAGTGTASWEARLLVGALAASGVPVAAPRAWGFGFVDECAPGGAPLALNATVPELARIVMGVILSGRRRNGPGGLRAAVGGEGFLTRAQAEWERRSRERGLRSVRDAAPA
jgi:hypothetical protein